MADIQMVLAADYSRNLSLEVKKGLYGRIKHGSYPFQAPIGYVNNGKGALKTVDPIKGPLVNLAFDLYCSGEYSISSLTDEMARRGLTGFYGQPVVRRNMETMLRNPFYIGKMFVTPYTMRPMSRAFLHSSFTKSVWSRPDGHRRERPSTSASTVDCSPAPNAGRP